MWLVSWLCTQFNRCPWGILIMNFFDSIAPYIGLIKLVALGAVIAGLFGFGYHAGAKHVQGEWDAANGIRVAHENAAILKRVEENKAQTAANIEVNKIITRTKDAELTKVRADIAASQLRVGPAICSGPASKAEATSTGSSDATDTGSRLLPSEMDRYIKALMLQMEETAATGRACQAWIVENGFFIQ